MSYPEVLFVGQMLKCVASDDSLHDFLVLPLGQVYLSVHTEVASFFHQHQLLLALGKALCAKHNY